MKKPDVPDNEAERLRELHKLDILDTPSEAVFDDLTRLASMTCNTLFSTVSIIDRERQWFKSTQGPLGVDETSRDVSFCGHALLGNELFIIEDALTDERFADNPLVTGGPMIRFYAGAPLRTKTGFAIGTLCVFDPKPGTLSEHQKEALTLLARQVEEKMERRVSEVIADNMASILEMSDSHIILFDPVQERINYIDPELQHQLGGEAGEDSRALFTVLFPDLPYERFFARERMIDSTQTLRKTTRVSLPDQPDRRAELRLLNGDTEDRHNRMLLYQDKTELSKTRDTAREAEDSLRVFYNLALQSKNQFIVTDAQGRIEWVNSSFEKLTGWSAREVKGRKPGDFLQGKDTSPLDRERISNHLKAQKPVVQEILNYTREGEPYWIELYIEPIFDAAGAVTHFGATQTNVTRRKEENQLLRDSRAEAERANRAKSQFLAKISHELRTPLNGIVGLSEKLLHEVPEDLKETVKTLDQSSQHLMVLLDDLLDLSHLQSGQLELAPAPVELDAMLEELGRLFSPRASMVGNRLSTEMGKNLPRMVLADETRLRQILINLVNNAIKFTREGSVCISARKIQGIDSNGLCKVRFAVSDTGPGIQRQDQDRIFESFEQLDNSSTRTHGGSGLGLAICKQLVEAMGGEIQLQSVIDQGSEFSFELQLAVCEPLAASDKSPAPQTTGAQFNPQHALVIDDNEVNCTVLADLLRRLGVHRVYTAQSARRGLAILENIQPDLMFVDLQMPEMNGFEMIEHLQRMFSQQGRTIPLTIACTAEVSEDKRQQCLNVGFDAHLGKPVTGASLSKLLRSLGASGDDISSDDESEPAGPNDRQDAATSSQPLIDSGSLKAAFLGNEDLLKDFLSLLVENLPEHSESIRQAIQTGNLSAHSASAHSIKGLVGYFNSDLLEQQASTLEEAMKENDLALSQQIFTQLARTLEQLQAEARVLLDTIENEAQL